MHGGGRRGQCGADRAREGWQNPLQLRASLRQLGQAEEGPAEEGPAEEGPAEEGPAEEGPAEEGPAVAAASVSRWWGTPRPWRCSWG